MSTRSTPHAERIEVAKGALSIYAPILFADHKDGDRQRIALEATVAVYDVLVEIRDLLAGKR